MICENINRLARNPAVTFTVDEQLRAAGVTLLCADEPFEESFGSILLRHINVGLARGYHFDLMRKTREGRQSGTRQGWHMGGIAAYGYQFSRHEHPNPHKRSRGLSRSRLDLDPVRAPVVRRIFDEYLYGPRGLDEICQLLNSDLDRFPPPVPTDPARRSGAWSRSSIWSILRNPKYTGFQVYNRRASRTRRGRPNDPTQWTWSTEPAHPAIVTTDEFKQVDAVATSKARSRRTNAPARPDPRPAQYLFHGMVRCACGLRMRGCRRKQTILYYQCQPARICGRPPAAGHPAGIYVAETALLDGVTGFLATAVYGPGRASYWERALTATDAPDPAAPARPSWSARPPTSRRGSAGRSWRWRTSRPPRRRDRRSWSASASSAATSPSARRRWPSSTARRPRRLPTPPSCVSCWPGCRCTATTCARCPPGGCARCWRACTWRSAMTTKSILSR